MKELVYEVKEVEIMAIAEGCNGLINLKANGVRIGKLEVTLMTEGSNLKLNQPGLTHSIAALINGHRSE